MRLFSIHRLAMVYFALLLETFTGKACRVPYRKVSFHRAGRSAPYHRSTNAAGGREGYGRKHAAVSGFYRFRPFSQNFGRYNRPRTRWTVRLRPPGYER